MKGGFPGAAEIGAVYALLDEPPTSYDCGVLCRQRGGEPPCCSASEAVPSVFDWEWRYLEARTRMWSRWKPPDAGRAGRFEGGGCDILVRCLGADRCERAYRSFCCRVFPLEPYVENDWKMTGLVFNTDFDTLCPLASRPRDLRPEFVRACLRGWTWLLGVQEGELGIYRDWSQTQRRRAGRSGLPLMGFDREGRWVVLRPGAAR